jgi:hypothetical protein
MKYLPIGIQTFASIINGTFTYVDKTGILYNIITKSGNRFFFSRPRRFGKSLTCSTLEAIFQGRRELFEGLAISKLDYNWKKHPVIRLDFSEVAHQTIEELKVSLGIVLDNIVKKHDLDIPSTMSTQDKFREIITESAAKYGPVVVIIDEYDKPILDHIHNKEMAQIMRDFLKSFYGILKGKDVDSNLRFLFITGVSKFSKISIFSELNNLNDLTLDEQTATLCGYTQEELELVFDEHIQKLATRMGKEKKDMLANLKYWYNGFQFSKVNHKVYNPFSILNCLGKQDFANYWFSSGTPAFIMKFVANNPEAVKKLIMMEASQLVVNDLEKLSVENYFENMLVLFLQAGYLTISEYNEKSRLFNLSYPNFEIRLSMSEQILELVTHLESVKIAGFIYRFQEAIDNDDINAFCTAMKDFFVLLPHTVIINLEKFYHGIFFTVTKLIGAKINSEDATNRGFIDAVLEGKNNTYIIEFKRDKSPDVALAQIENKEYFAKFKIEGDNRRKPVVLVGINFDYNDKDKNDKGIMLDWKIKEM